jgi:hypothetical protein
MEVVAVADWTVVNVTAGYKTVRDGVALRMGAGALAGKVVRHMTIGATAAEGRVQEPVLNSPMGLKPRLVGLQLSRLCINLDTLCHGERLRGGGLYGVESKGTGDVFSLE